MRMQTVFIAAYKATVC